MLSYSNAIAMVTSIIGFDKTDRRKANLIYFDGVKPFLEIKYKASHIFIKWKC